MENSNTINFATLDDIIIGRVEPQIYAFSTQTIPNYLKVGDTYRPIEVRLNEWRKYFPNLEKKFGNAAKVDDEIFFRDYAVHFFLENELKRKRLKQDTFKNIPYYSNEFFENATEKDLQDAIIDIKNGHRNNESKYQYYRFDESHIPIIHTYSRTENYDARPNQQKTIEKFREAIDKGRTNLLMYAVMRFGKSFTSMCCAVEMGAKLVVVVSAKADVKEEWKKTVESHLKFDTYCFLDSNDLLKSDTIIAEKQKANEKIVLFLTLQDLQGDEIKLKHKAIFENKIDLLLIDETHFGARATEYGKVLNAKEVKNEEKFNEVTIEDVEKIHKVFNTKIRIHLSGTPYRILMNSEFSNDDIIAFYQFTDIAEDQRAWDVENLNKDDTKEWDNPYYGFPQMIRFAFNPNESSRKKMEELKKNGTTYAFSELLKPQSITKDKANKHQKFLHEQEILDLLKVIDGSENDANLLSFLDYDKIKEGKMCRHIVCVLPYRASCDAMEALLKCNNFKHLGNYEIINISGVENDKNFKDTQSIQAKIKKCESENLKTITLTVNRMLTGSTVPEWDTMLYMKDSSSPQEYDQAIFRLQNQYIKVFKEPNGDVVKFNMKPQTLLVDFDPNRMFQIQEHKSQIYNVNTESNGNSKLATRIQKELEISPIIVLNNQKIVQVQAADILDAVRKYSSSRSVLDEATTIGIDYDLLDIEAIKAEIERQNKINSPGGMKIKPLKGEGVEIDTGGKPDGTGANIGGEGDKDKVKPSIKENEKEAEHDYKAQFAMYYARILFFAFLTDSKVKSLQDIIHHIEGDADNLRIASNLELNVKILELFQQHLQPFILSNLDYKIQNINGLANDTAIAPIERASNAMKKFARLSESEVVTPEIITDKMINALPAEAFEKGTLFLDIASKQGEFVYAVFKKYGKEVANNFYSIPTSRIAYEFTRKVYNLLELDMELLIEQKYTSYDLIKENDFIKNDTLKINAKVLKFGVIVGNPPYQDSKEKTSDAPIYHLFMDMAYELSERAILITPGRFLFNAGKTPNSWNEKMLNDKHLKVISYDNKSSDVFSDVGFKGGVAITYRDKKQIFGQIGVYVTQEDIKTILQKVNVRSFESLSEWVYSPESYKFSRKIHTDYPEIESKLSKGHLYDLTTNIFEKLPNIFHQVKPKDGGVYIQILGRENNERILKWIKRDYIESHKNLDFFKVLLPKSNGTGTLGEKLSSPIIGEPTVGHNQTFISIGALNSSDEANNLLKYISTKFVRLLLGTLKVTQDNKKDVWRNTPLQNFKPDSDIDWSKSIPEIDEQLYAKYKLTEEEINFIENMIKPMN